MIADPHDDASGAASGSGSRRSPAPRLAADVGRGADEAPDSTPVRFGEHVDGAWLRWSVVEHDARKVPGVHGPRCLIFASEGCIRRVWDFPADWRALDAAGLTALSWKR
jgi:hypothetical protein